MRLRTAAVVFAMMLTLGAAAEAQTHRSHLGPHIAFNVDVEEVALGAQFSAPIANFLEFYPSFDYYLVDVGSLWAVNADLKFRIAGSGLDWLYLGGGLNVTRRSFEGEGNNDTGLNLLAGFETIAGRVHPYGELRFTLSGGSTAQFAFGLNFTLNP